MNTLIDLEDVADALFPVARLVEQRIGRRISPPTLWRWRTRGIRGVRLECYLIGGVWCTTPAALADSSAASLPPVEPPTERDPATTRRLAAAGLL